MLCDNSNYLNPIQYGIYFKNTIVWGIMAQPSSNFVVSSSVMIKFGVVIESDKFAPKSQIF